MLYLILGLFAVAAVMGLIIANAIISGKPSTPKAAVVAHGLFAATALGLLIYFALQNPDNYPNLSLILFIVAALGGAVLLIRDLQKKPGPVALVVIHALLAVTAFVILLLFAL